MEPGELPPGAVSEVGLDMPPGALHPVVAQDIRNKKATAES